MPTLATTAIVVWAAVGWAQYGSCPPRDKFTAKVERTEVVKTLPLGPVGMPIGRCRRRAGMVPQGCGTSGEAPRSAVARRDSDKRSSFASGCRRRLATETVAMSQLMQLLRGFIAQQGFDPVYGARPLRRFIAREVETRIGRALLSGDVHDGAVIRVTLREGELAVEYQNRPPASDAA
jgi:ClpA/ClpB-like protein